MCYTSWTCLLYSYPIIQVSPFDMLYLMPLTFSSILNLKHLVFHFVHILFTIIHARWKKTLTFLPRTYDNQIWQISFDSSYNHPSVAEPAKQLPSRQYRYSFLMEMENLSYDKIREKDNTFHPYPGLFFS